MKRLSAAIFTLAIILPHADAQQEPPPTAENVLADNEITPELDRAVAHGLDWLAAQQTQDGSFASGRLGPSVAVTSLACLAFMADGHMPGRGQYGDVIRAGLEYVLRMSTESGLISEQASHGPMYGHGFATLFLGEVYGMTGGDEELTARVHEALVKAVRLIEQSQNDEGGWRYNPVPVDADVSVTICQVMGLRSARNAGIEVSKHTIDRAVEYVKLCQNRDGGFRYQLQTGSSGWARSAAGVATLNYAGIYEGDFLDRGIAYLFNENILTGGANSRPHFYYGHYYAVQAMYLAGGDAWKKWWPGARELMLREQLRDGSWEDQSFGPEYATAMALIVLQMPKRYLPIFQR